VRVQSIDAAGIHCPTFNIDPSGRLLVAAHAVGAPDIGWSRRTAPRAGLPFAVPHRR
jgi:hypothetical protein